MKRSFIISALLFAFLLGTALITQGSGIVPAIVPALVPAANKNGNSSVFMLANNNALTANSTVCTDANGNLNTTGTGCPLSAVTSTTPITTSGGSVTTDQAMMELSLAAGYLNKAGAAFKFYGAGVYTVPVATTPQLTFKIKLCTVSGCGSGTVVTLVSIQTSASVASITNNNWSLNIAAVTATTGATGNLEVHGPVTVDLAALTTNADTVFGDTNTAVSGNIDLTAALFVDWTIAFSAASASNTMTQRQGIVSPGGPSGGGGGGSGAVTQISKQVLAAPAASITFNAIAGTFNSLYFTYQGRGDTAAATAGINLTFNADGGANYDDADQNTNANSLVAAQTAIACCIITAANNTAGAAGAGTCTIPNYAATTFWKNMECGTGGRLSTAPVHYTSKNSGQWRNTAAITSITLTASAGNFIAGTTVILYGVN